MLEQELFSKCQKKNDSKILIIVVDGLGGLAHPKFENKSELEYAKLPNLHAFVQRKETALGTMYPVLRGVIPGSAAGHFALFGYDPLLEKHQMGRGILEALDLDVEIGQTDVVARLNMATVENGIVKDRRAGRIDAAPLAAILNKELVLSGVNVEFIATKEHRGVLFIREKSQEISQHVTDTDPGEEGKPILTCRPVAQGDLKAARTAEYVNEITKRAITVLSKDYPNKGALLRGFSSKPEIKRLSELHGLTCAAIADYPLYRGIAKLFGMKLAEPVKELDKKAAQLKELYSSADFFFVHYKTPDSKGEDKDFLGKVKALEEFDAAFPKFVDAMNLSKDVIVVTGDHSTPSVMGKHSHHSVPLAIFSALNKGFDESKSFTEKECARGAFGKIMGKELIGCMLARAGKLQKFDL